MKYIGVDLGGTNIAVGVVDEEGKILCQGSTPTLVGRDYKEIIKDMAHLIKEVIKESTCSETDIKSVGIGVPGIVNSKLGTILFATNLYWKNVPIREELQKHINLPVYLGNDGTAAGVAEAVCGACSGAEHSITITLGTGVGAGIIIGGKPYSGAHGVGSELGHMIVEVDGIECSCGNRGCLERYTSATALIREGRNAARNHPESLINTMVNGDLDKITGKVVIDAAKEGDHEAKKVFDKFIYYLSMGIVTIINSFDPEIIAIGGGVSRAGNFLLDALEKEVEKHIFCKDNPYGRLCFAQLGNEAGIIGAAMLGKLK